MKRSPIKSKRLRDALDSITRENPTGKPGGAKPKPATSAKPKPKAAKPSDGQNLRSGRSPDKPKPKPAKPAASTTPAKPKPKATTPKPKATTPKPKPSAQRNTGSGRDGTFGSGTNGGGRPSDGNPNPKPSQRSSPNRRSLRDRVLGTREEREYINESGRRSAAESARRGRERQASRAPKEGQTRPQRIGGVGGRTTGKTEVYRNGKWIVKK